VLSEEVVAFEVTTPTMNTIDAEFGRAPQGFSTPEQAIAFELAQANAHHDNKIELCIGRQVVSVKYRESGFAMRFENGKILELKCSDFGVSFSIEDGDASRLEIEEMPRDSIIVRLGNKESIWRRGEILLSLVGTKLRRLHQVDPSIFLEFSDIGILSVNILINRASQRPFLFWGYSD
jgi:hypothetical protein